MYYVIVEPSINLVLFLIMKCLRNMLHLLSIMENMINRWHTWHYFLSLEKARQNAFFFHNHSNRFCVILHFIARYTSSTIYTRVDMYRQMKCYYLRSGIFHYFSSRLHRNVYFQAFILVRALFLNFRQFSLMEIYFYGFSLHRSKDQTTFNIT